MRNGADPDALGDATREVLGRIEEFLADLWAHCLDHQADSHHAVMTRHKLFIRLESQVLALCDDLRDVTPESPLAAWSVVLVEGLDALVLELIDTLGKGDAASRTSTSQLMGNRGELLRKLRDASLRNGAGLGAAERARLARLANIAEHAFLLMTQLSQEYRRAEA